MTIKNITINTIITIAFLISHHYAWNMERPSNSCLEIIPYVEFNLKKLIKEYDAQLIKKNNAQYNIDNSSLVALAPEMLETVLSKISPLDDAIQTALTLRKTCTTFNELPLEHFGKAYQHHDLTEKNKTLKNVLTNMDNNKYWNQHYGALILVLAKAEDNTSYPLMKRILINNDQEALTILLQNGANPDQKDFYRNPYFFNAKKVALLEIFKNYNCNFNQPGIDTKYDNNALWTQITWTNFNSKWRSKLSDRIKFYLDNHVNAKIIHSDDGYTLLHHLVSHRLFPPKDINDYVRTGKLLLRAIPHLVNSLNKKKETPIDTARQYIIKNTIKNRNNLMDKTTNGNDRIANIKLIKLFKEYGGKTAEQLKQNKKK